MTTNPSLVYKEENGSPILIDTVEIKTHQSTDQQDRGLPHSPCHLHHPHDQHFTTTINTPSSPHHRMNTNQTSERCTPSISHTGN
eukprot:m.175742 g.175742  ORF g.175742 m.175742 type:complete len:85 (-) comp31828_c2_seq2:415-669(-)